MHCSGLQARDPEAEHARLSRRVARMERTAKKLRHQMAREGVTASAEMVEDLEAQEEMLSTAREQLLELQVEVEQRQRQRAEKAELRATGATPLRASADPAEQARLEEM